MSEEFKTKTGRVLTDEDFEALADEAEAGYPVFRATLKEGDEIIKEIPVISTDIGGAMRSAIDQLASPINAAKLPVSLSVKPIE